MKSKNKNFITRTFLVILVVFLVFTGSGLGNQVFAQPTVNQCSVEPSSGEPHVCVEITEVSPVKPSYYSSFEVEVKVTGLAESRTVYRLELKSLGEFRTQSLERVDLEINTAQFEIDKVFTLDATEPPFDLNDENTLTATIFNPSGSGVVGLATHSSRVSFEEINSVNSAQLNLFLQRDSSGLDFSAFAFFIPVNSTSPQTSDDVAVTFFWGDQSPETPGEAISAGRFFQDAHYRAEHTFRPGSWTVRAVATDSSGTVLAETSETVVVNELSSGTGTFDAFLGGLLSLVNGIIGIVIGLFRWVMLAIGSWVVLPLLEATLSIEAGNLAGGPILIGWTFARDLVNMLFILFLIIIGLATMLRVESYNYRKLLVNLILMALLVNFSLLIGRVIIQIADAAQFTFLPLAVQQTADGTGTTTGIEGVKLMYKTFVTAHVSSVLDGFSSFTADTSGALSVTFTLIFQMMLEWGVVITFAAVAIFMLIRTVALWILLVISPFAFALSILPTTSSYSKLWWSNFFKYAMFGPIIAFFLRLTMVVYSQAFQIVPKVAYTETLGTAKAPPDLIDFVGSLGVGTGTLSQSLTLGLVYVMVLSFMWGGLIISNKMGIYGASVVNNLAQRGMSVPFIAGKNLASFGAEKFFEKTGVDVRPRSWIEGWKRSREISKAAREATGAAKALERRSALGQPTTFFQRYWSPQGVARVLRGGEMRGRGLINDAQEMREDLKFLGLPRPEQQEQINSLYSEANDLRDQAEADGTSLAERRNLLAAAEQKDQEARNLAAKMGMSDEETAEEIKNLKSKIREKEALARQLITPDDYFTQQDFRGAVNEELSNIRTDNWHELVDLFRSAQREKKPARAAAIMLKLTETFNENELANQMQYTRDMNASESADGRAHKKNDFFAYSAEGMENFRKLILEEEFGLGEQMSMQIMNDVSDIAEKSRHFNIMRMYDSKFGRLTPKSKAERQEEQSFEMDKMDSRALLQQGNRLIGYSEVPDEDYDLTGSRTSYIEPVTIAYYLKNYPSIAFRVGRGEMNPSQAMHAAIPHNAQRIMDAASTIEDPVEREKYTQAMEDLIAYGKEKAGEMAEKEGGSSVFGEVHSFFREADRREGKVWPPRTANQGIRVTYDQVYPTITKQVIGSQKPLQRREGEVEVILNRYYSGKITNEQLSSEISNLGAGLSDKEVEQIVRGAAKRALKAKLGRGKPLSEDMVFGGEAKARLKPFVKQDLRDAVEDAIQVGMERGLKLSPENRADFRELILEEIEARRIELKGDLPEIAARNIARFITTSEASSDSEAA